MKFYQKSSGTLCKTLVLVKTCHTNDVYPINQQSKLNELSVEDLDIRFENLIAILLDKFDSIS